MLLAAAAGMRRQCIPRRQLQLHTEANKPQLLVGAAGAAAAAVLLRSGVTAWLCGRSCCCCCDGDDMQCAGTVALE
jgi:hypothetical protein